MVYEKQADIIPISKLNRINSTKTRLDFSNLASRDHVLFKKG